MSFRIRRVDYFYCTVKDEPGASFELLKTLEDLGINLLAFSAIPIGPIATQLTIFPEEAIELTDEAKKAGLKLEGPHHAFLVQGDDELGALTDVHHSLYEAKVNIYASLGVTDGEDSFGYIIYVRPEMYEVAAQALQL
jgi:hypothetical protein